MLNFTIDGTDAYTSYGIFVQQYGYKELVQMPAFKTITTIDWPDEDGIEADLADPQLDTRLITINFYALNYSKANQFLTLIDTTAYHTFYFAALDKSFKLRLVSQTANLLNGDKENFSLQFADDFPSITASTPVDLGVPETGYKIDGVDLSTYGIQVLSGTRASIMTKPEVKTKYVGTNAVMSGIEYGGNSLSFISDDELTEEEKEALLNKDASFTIDDESQLQLSTTDLYAGTSFSLEDGFLVVDPSDEDIANEAIYEIKDGELIESIGEVEDKSIPIFYKSKDVTINCLLNTSDIATFWTNYNTLFSILTGSGERSFYTAENDTSYPCFYKSSEVSTFDIIKGAVWCKFTIVLTFTKFRTF